MSPTTVTFYMFPPLFRDQTSLLFGFFSPVPPTMVKANVLNTGRELRSPFVYTPSPEPSAFVLLELGALGVLWGRRRLFA